MHVKMETPDGMCTQHANVMGGGGFNGSCLLQSIKGKFCLKRKTAQQIGKKGRKQGETTNKRKARYSYHTRLNYALGILNTRREPP